MGRSGSTWVSSIINHRYKYREIFEPFLPVRVPVARDFEYCQYISPSDSCPSLKIAAHKILTGRFKNAWTDKNLSTYYSRYQLVKDIRTNLMIGWLSEVYPSLKIILLIRHSHSVISSWRRLDWGVEPEGNRRDLDIILSQKELIREYPEIRKGVELFDIEDNTTSLAFLWAILNYIPLKQNVSNKFHVLKYEDLIMDTENTVNSLFQYLEIKIDQDKLNSVLDKPSRTSYLKRGFKIFENSLSKDQIQRVNSIVEFFNLHELYW